VLAAVGTALPETMIPIVAVLAADFAVARDPRGSAAIEPRLFRRFLEEVRCMASRKPYEGTGQKQCFRTVSAAVLRATL
jgi:hypothetical protein